MSTVVAELIAIAKIRSGKSQVQLAEEMGHADRTRLSKIASGRLKADASEIVYLAKEAKVDPIDKLAQIEGERNPVLANVWKGLSTHIGNV